MKTKYIIAMGALASTFAFVPPCTAEPYMPPPQNAAQPQIYPPPTRVVWDGSEYVGQSNGKDYYLGPNNTWLPLDNTRQQRFDEWQKNQANGNLDEQLNPGASTRSQGQYSSGNNPNGQPNQTGNTPSQGAVRGQNAMEQSGQTGAPVAQGQQTGQNLGANNPNGQPNQTGNTRSGSAAKGQNAIEQSGQTGIPAQGQQLGQNPGGNNPNAQSSQIRNTRHQGHDLGQTRTAPPPLQQ